MRNRINLKRRNYLFKYKFKSKKNKKSKKEKIIIILLLIVSSIFFSLYIINQKITPILMMYATKKSKTIANVVITQAVNDNIFSDMNKEELFSEVKDSNGNVTSTNFNPVIINTILNKVTFCVQDYLEKLESGKIKELNLSNNIMNEYDLKTSKQGVIYEIPSGVIFNNALVSNLGPKVPVKININGDVVSNIKTDVTDYGINNALIKVTINIKVYIQVVIPFKTKEVMVETDIPVIMQLIKGEVPSYYYPNLSN